MSDFNTACKDKVMNGYILTLSALMCVGNQGTYLSEKGITFK